MNLSSLGMKIALSVVGIALCLYVIYSLRWVGVAALIVGFGVAIVRWRRKSGRYVR
jgi:hypothetical protein